MRITKNLEFLLTDALNAPSSRAAEMREITVTLPDGRFSIHKRPVDLPDHIAYIDRSMDADEFFALHKMARKHTERAASLAFSNKGEGTSELLGSVCESPTFK